MESKLNYQDCPYINGVPLCIFLSETYQRFLKTGEPEVTDDVRRRYDALVDKRLSGVLSPEEADELCRLETEMDGSDYADQPPDKSWREAREAEQREAEQKLNVIRARIERKDEQ